MPLSEELILSEVSEGDSTKSASDEEAGSAKESQSEPEEKEDEYAKRRIEVQTLLNKANEEVEIP